MLLLDQGGRQVEPILETKIRRFPPPDGLSSARMNAGDAEVRGTTIETIQQAVADMFGLPAEELKQKSPRAVVTVPRQVAMYLAKRLTDSSLPEIGRYYGGMHHTTVMHAIAKIEDRRRTDSAVDRVLSELLTSLSHH